MKRVADVQALYGKVPLEQFDRARLTLTNLASDSKDTFRENYEIYGAQTGVVTVSYSGKCQVCQLSLRFEETHPLPGFGAADGKSRRRSIQDAGREDERQG